MKFVFAFLLMVIGYTFVGYTLAQEEIILAALQAQLDAPQLRSTLTQDIEGETTITIIDYVAPDRFRMVMPDTEFIVIAGQSYQKEGDTWQVLDMDMSSMIQQARESVLEDFVLSDIQTLPSERIGGIPCDVYSYTTTWGDFESQDKLWIETATGLPLQHHSEGTILGDFTVSTNQFDYDSSLTIVAPIQ